MGVRGYAQGGARPSCTFNTFCQEWWEEGLLALGERESEECCAEWCLSVRPGIINFVSERGD